MKDCLKLFFFILLINVTIQTATLLNQTQTPKKERKLSVLAGYSEVKDSENYIRTITNLTEKIKQMRNELMLVKDDALEKVNKINKNISILDSNTSLNRLLNNEFTDQLENILNL